MTSAGKLARDHRSEVRQGNMLEGLLVTSPETPEDHVLTRCTFSHRCRARERRRKPIREPYSK